MRRSLAAGALAIAASALFACAPGIAGVWKGSGKVQLDRFFEVTLDLRNEEAPQAFVKLADGQGFKTRVCALSEVEGRVSFKVALQSGADCSGPSAYKFVAERGRDVIVGKVLDASSNEVGMFRAFRMEQ